MDRVIKPFCIVKRKKVQISCTVNHAADQQLCFRYKQSTIPLLSNLKLQLCSHFLWLWVRPGWKPWDRFSYVVAYIAKQATFKLIASSKPRTGFTDQCSYNSKIVLCHYMLLFCQRFAFSKTQWHSKNVWELCKNSQKITIPYVRLC